MELADNELMDLLLARKEPEGEVDLPQSMRLLARIAQPLEHSCYASFVFSLSTYRILRRKSHD